MGFGLHVSSYLNSCETRSHS